MADEVQDVEAGDTLAVEQLRRERLVLLQHRREQIAGLHFRPAGALHVQHGRLQHSPEGHGLRGVLFATARKLLDLLAQIGVEHLAELRQIGAAGAEDGFAVGVVSKRVEQVFERQVRVATRGGLAVRDGQHDLEGLAEHHAFSMAACSG